MYSNTKLFAKLEKLDRLQNTIKESENRIEYLRAEKVKTEKQIR